jgi:hypothetical protein
MNGVLVRVAIDQSSKGGMWNGPINPKTGEFVYVPIPDKEHKCYGSGLQRSFKEVLPTLNEFVVKHKISDLGFPESLLNRSMHLDPDFEHLTYGDNGKKQGRALKSLIKGDFVVFFSSLTSVENNKLVYALIGFYEIQENIAASNVKPERYHENAHTRWHPISETDIIIRANPAKSGRLKQCIPIGEYRDGAYRLTKKLEKVWGGLQVKDGFLQRRVTPRFTDPKAFRKWFDSQNVTLLRSNR